MGVIEDTLAEIVSQFVAWVPNIVGVVIILLIGWGVGRLLGKGLSRVLDKVGVDDALRKTFIGRALERSGVTVVRFFDLIIRWFVYLIAILAASNVLGIAALSNFMNTVVQYLPSFIAGLFMIIAGILVADFVGDSFVALGREANIEFSSLIAGGLRLILYAVTAVIGLSVMKIDVSIIYVFANALAWGVAAGIAVGLGIAFGWGFKDAVAARAKDWIKSATQTAKKAEEIQAKKPKPT